MAQQRGEETRKQIMSAAIELFCRQGYDAAGVAEICTSAKVSKGAFYYHFPSKQALFLAIMDKWLRDLNDQLLSFHVPGKTIPQSILDMADTMRVVFKDASGQLPMFMEFMIQASRDKAIWNAAIAPYQQYQESFAALIKEGVVEGSLKADIDDQVAARVLISFAVGLLLQGIVVPEAADWENVASQGVRMILESIQRSVE